MATIVIQRDKEKDTSPVMYSTGYVMRAPASGTTALDPIVVIISGPAQDFSAVTIDAVYNLSTHPTPTKQVAGPLGMGTYDPIHHYWFYTVSIPLANIPSAGHFVLVPWVVPTGYETGVFLRRV